MKYFIYNVMTYSPKNKAQKEICDFVRKYENLLIYGEDNFNIIHDEIIEKIMSINEKYPKTKPILFENSDSQMRCKASGALDGYVFLISYKRVKHEFPKGGKNEY